MCRLQLLIWHCGSAVRHVVLILILMLINSMPHLQQPDEHAMNLCEKSGGDDNNGQLITARQKQGRSSVPARHTTVR